MAHVFPTTRVAAVQAASVFMDREASTEKACSLIAEASRKGAQLVAFPETYIAGYPHWAWLHNVKDGEKFFPLLVKSSVSVPGPETDQLCGAAKKNGIYVAIGLNESSESSFAEVFNTMLLIGADGRILGKHRKLIPTFYEKLCWSNGDGAGLRTHKTPIGCIGMLICGENANPMARYALIAQAEQIHIANFPSLPQSGQIGGYNMRKAIEIRAAAHSFEGKVFTITSSSVIDKRIIELLGDTPDRHETLKNGGTGLTGVFGPNGMICAGPLPDNEEGILYADINLEEGIAWKLYHDYSGNYNRFDVLSLNVNRRPTSPLNITEDAVPSRESTPERWEDALASNLQRLDLSRQVEMAELPVARKEKRKTA